MVSGFHCRSKVTVTIFVSIRDNIITSKGNYSATPIGALGAAQEGQDERVEHIVELFAES